MFSAVHHSIRSQLLTLCWGLCVLAVIPQEVHADPITDYNVAVEFYKQQRWDQAAEACADFLKRNPNDERLVMIRLYWAQSLLHLRKFKDARDQFRLYLEKAGEHPDRGLAMYRIGECSYFMTDYPAAETDLQAFLKQFPKHDLAKWAWVYLGESQLRMKKYEPAVQAFETYLELAPDGPLLDDAEFGLATAFDALNQTEKANAVYKRIADRPTSPRAADAIFNIAAGDFDKQQFASAAEGFQRVIKEFPKSRLVPSAHLNAGYSLYSLSRFAEALEEFQQAATEPSLTQIASYWKGLSQKSLGDFVAAATTFSETYNAAPNGPLAEKLMFQWGDAEFRKQDYAKAVELFTSVTEKWPNSDLADDALHSACEAALQAGNVEQAVQLNQQFREKFPNSGLTQVQDLLNGRILITQGTRLGVESPEGKAAFEQAAAILKKVADTSSVETTKTFARFQLARIAERFGQDAKVLEELQPILSIPTAKDLPEYRDAILMRANARLRMQEASEALQDYQTYLSEAKTDTEKLAGLTGQASALILLKNWNELEPTLQTLQQIDTKNTRLGALALSAGDAAFEQQKWDAARKFFQISLDQGQDTPYWLPALSGRAHVDYEQKEFLSAADAFGQLATLGESDPILASHSLYMQALSLQQAGRPKEALEIYRKASEKFTHAKKEAPLSGDALAVARNAYRAEKGGARVARELHDQETANRLYEMAYQELKTFPVEEQGELDLLINEWADLSYNAQNYERSDELFALLIKECPKSPLADDARLILAESMRFGGKKAEAIAEFRKLADSTDSDEFVQQRALTHLLDLAAEAENWTEVVEAGEQMIQKFPGTSNELYARFRIGEGQLQQKKYSDAEKTLEKVRQSLAENLAEAPAWWPEAWFLLAEAQFWQMNYGSMNETLKDFQEKAPDSPLIYRVDVIQGRALENQARFEEARAAYQRVIDSESGRGTETAAEAQFRVAETYLKEKNLPVALREYYKVYSGYDAPRYESAALYQAGTCDASMKHYPEAAKTFEKLITEFPDSEFALKARERLKELEPLLPAKDDSTAK